MRKFAQAVLCAALVCCLVAVVTVQAQGQSDNKPNGRDIGTLTQHGPTGDTSRIAGGNSGNGIFYHGGPLLTAGPNVHFIWYGGWSGNTATTILPAFIQNEGGSAYFNINTTYYNGSGTHVANVVNLATQANDNYSQGKNLTDAQIQAIVAAQNPTDTNGVYFVLTSADVNETSGFCTQYCGWHTHATINGKDIKYSFVGNPDRCPSACEIQTCSPNGNSGADGMASIIAHELEEATTDPDLNAWYDRRGAENADKCAWTFGTTSTGSATCGQYSYNITLGGAKYMIQQNWVNAGGGYCSMQF